MILQITSSYFCAAVIFDGTKVIDTAPILHYMKGWTAQRVKLYCDTKQWKYAVINNKEEHVIERSPASL